MKNKFQGLLVFFFLFSGFLVSGQNKLERAHRIKKAQFPMAAIDFVSNKIKGIKKAQYYKEVDTSETRYSVKFKRDRLHYHVDFNKSGALQSIGFRVKEIDIPSDTYSKIESHLQASFSTYKIRRLFQQYQYTKEKSENEFLKDAFQNMMLPSTMYRTIIKGKNNGKKKEVEAWYNAEGDLKKLHNTLPANYDRILY